MSKYLNQLGRLHMIEHLHPMNASEGSRRGIWRLSDHYLRAWFEFVRANRTDLEARRASEVFRGRVRDQLDHFVSKPAFEDAVREHARGSVGSDAEFPGRANIGAWWGPIPVQRYPGTRRTREGEVEVVGYEGKRLVLAGEAKWSHGLEDGAALAQLRRTVPYVPGYDPARTKFAVYAREGFTERFRVRAHAEGVILRTVADLFA